MKNTLLLSFCFLMFASGLFSQNSKAIEYNDKIIDEQSKIILLTLEVVEFMDTDLDKSEKKRLEAVKQIDKSILVIEQMGAFEGNNELRSSSLELFKFYKKIFAEEYKVILDILKKGENITEEDITVISEFYNTISEEEFILDEKLEKAQGQFAEKYGFEIEENELQEEIDDL